MDFVYHINHGLVLILGILLVAWLRTIAKMRNAPPRDLEYDAYKLCAMVYYDSTKTRLGAAELADSINNCFGAAVATPTDDKLSGIASFIKIEGPISFVIAINDDSSMSEIIEGAATEAEKKKFLPYDLLVKLKSCNARLDLLSMDKTLAKTIKKLVKERNRDSFHDPQGLFVIKLIRILEFESDGLTFDNIEGFWILQ